LEGEVNLLRAISQFDKFDDSDRFVFSYRDTEKLFPEDSPLALKAGLKRLVKQGVLIRASRGVFVYGKSNNLHKFPREHIARTMRRGDYNYVSLESALSQYGVISQIPIDRITVMTTGRRGEYKTPFGTIEFTHTQRSPLDITDDLAVVAI
jgi:predicted transcriptional regulator of viral defense system